MTAKSRTNSHADRHPLFWIGILTAPRRVIREITVGSGFRIWAVPAGLFGISYTMNQLAGRSAGQSSSLQALLLIGILGGVAIGWALVYVMGALVRVIGSVFGGQGRTEQLRAAYAWSWIPSILVLPIWIPKVILLGAGAFTPWDLAQKTPGSAALVAVAMGLQLAAGSWTAVLLVVTTSEIHEFSWWRSLATLTLSVIVVMAGLFPVLWILAGFGIWR